MEDSKRDTIGKIASELLTKQTETQSPIEIEREMQSEYMKNLMECIDRGYKEFPGNFYVTVITKNEKLMENVFRNYFAPRQSCPTPDYDQSVFRYNRKDSRVEYLWTLPGKDACYHLRDNALKVVDAEKELLRYVLGFFDGSLLKIAKHYNNEQADSPLILNNEIKVSGAGPITTH